MFIQVLISNEKKQNNNNIVKMKRFIQYVLIGRKTLTFFTYFYYTQASIG